VGVGVIIPYSHPQAKRRHVDANDEAASEPGKSVVADVAAKAGRSAVDDNSVGSHRHKIRDCRTCKLCGVSDKDEDPIVPSEYIFWGRAPTSVPIGYACMYCERVYTRRYSVGYPGGTENFAKELGGSEEVFDDFKEWRSKLVAHIQTHGNNRSARMIWTKQLEPLRTLETVTAVRQEITQPEDHVMEEEEYVGRFGDPDFNGKGHRRVAVEGCPRGVQMPGARIWRVKRSHVNEAQLRTVQQSSTEGQELGTDMFESNLRSLQSSIFGARATGETMTLNSFFAPTSSTRADTATAPTAAASSSSGDSAPGFGLFSIRPVTSPALPAPVCARTGAKNMTGPKAKPSARKPPAPLGGLVPLPADPSGRVEGKGGAKPRGAPPRDLLALTEAKVDQWAVLEEASEFWPSIKVHVRTTQRFLVDIEKRLEGLAQTSQEWMAHKIAYKKVHAMLSIQKAFSASGAFSTSLVKAMDEADHYLQMPPYEILPADLQHPAFLQCQRHEVKALASPPAGFWPKLDCKALRQVGFEDSATVLLATQRDFMSQKIISVGQEYKDVDGTMKAYAALLLDPAKELIELCPDFVADLDQAFTLVMFRDCQGDTVMTEFLRRCVAAAADEDQKVARRSGPYL
jgi:hypothetical protein